MLQPNVYYANNCCTYIFSMSGHIVIPPFCSIECHLSICLIQAVLIVSRLQGNTLALADATEVEVDVLECFFKYGTSSGSL